MIMTTWEITTSAVPWRQTMMVLLSLLEGMVSSERERERRITTDFTLLCLVPVNTEHNVAYPLLRV
jgi:hypothetical protein